MDILSDKYKLIDGEMCVATDELCSKLGISRKTLSEWEQKGCPKAARGWWPIWNILKWRGLTSGGIKTEEELESISLSQQKILYEAELKKQQAEEAALKNAISRGEYISKTDVTVELERFFVVLKRSMLGYSRKIANELSSFVDASVTRRIEKMITELTKDALRQFSIDGVYTPTKKKEKA